MVEVSRTLLAAYAVIGGLLTLIGWATGLHRLTDWIGNDISMKPNTAVCAISAGIALILSQRALRSSAIRMASLGLGLFPALVAFLTLVEHLTSWNFGIDTLLFHEPPGARATVSPGRMGLPAATSFLLIAIGLVALQGRDRGRRAATALGLAGAAIALIPIVGHIYGADQTYAEPLSGIAWQTATMILALGIALVLSVPDWGLMSALLEKNSAGVLVRHGLPIIIGLPLVLGGLRVLAQRWGWVDTPLGTAILIILQMALLAGVLLWAAKAVRSREALLSESESRKSRAFESALDCIITITQDGTIIEFNAAAERTFGYPRESVLGRELAELLIPQAYRDRHRLGLARAVADREGPILTQRLELSGLRANGAEFPIEVAVSRIPTARGPIFTGFLRDISGRKQAEESLRQSQEAYRTLADQVEDYAIFRTDVKGRVQTWNRGVRRVLGFDEAEFIGQDIAWAIFTPQDIEGGIPKRELEAAAAKGNVSYDRWMSRQNGERFFASGSISALVKAGELIGFTHIIRDQTELRRAQENLRESEVRYRRLFEAAQDGILLLDAHTGKIVDANAFMAGLTGLDRSELLGLELHEIGMFSDVNASKEAIRELLRDKYVRYEHLPILSRGGERIDVEVIANVYHEDHTLVAQCNIRDISERVAMQKRIAEQTAQLAAESRGKDEFLAMLSHELRNPLAAIRSAVHLLKLQEPPGDNATKSRAREVIERQVGNLVKLVNDLMDVARVIRGQVQLTLEIVDLNRLVEHAVETTLPLIEENQHSLTLNLCGDSVWVKADATRMEEVFINLLNNAAKYTPEGGRIEVSCERSADGESASLRVRDSGVGIGKELLPRVFDLFTQADRSLARSAGGLGIGLTLAQRLVQLHGGTIEVHSPPEGHSAGSEFIVRLDGIIPCPESQSPHPSAGDPPRRADGVHVLVVDDNVDQLTMVATVLRHTGCTVESASTGAEALTIAQRWQPEVILLDIGLPGLDGYEVARRLRANPDLRNSKLIAVTGYGRDQDIARAREAGFDAHLVKPFDFDQLNELIATSAAGTSPGAASQ